MVGEKRKARTRPPEAITINVTKKPVVPTAAVSDPSGVNLKGTLTEHPGFDYQAHIGKTEKLCPESL